MSLLIPLPPASSPSVAEPGDGVFTPVKSHHLAVDRDRPLAASPSTIASTMGSSSVGFKGATDIFSITDYELAERYKFVEEVGYGNWGSVWKCEPRRQGAASNLVAIKLVHRQSNNHEKAATTHARVKSLWGEFKMLRAFKAEPHPNMVHFTEFVLTPSYALVVMDYHAKLIPVELAESRAKPYFRQLLSAVGFLHNNGCSHNDIKPSNILLSAQDQVKLCDFGFATKYDVDSPTRFMSSKTWGTPEYLSPERCKGQTHDERLSDIYSLGVTFYEIVVGRTPFEADDKEEFLTKEALEVYYQRTLTAKFYGVCNISAVFETLIKRMIEPQVTKRVGSCLEAASFSFFQDKPERPKPSVYTHSSIPRTPSRKPKLPDISIKPETPTSRGRLADRTNAAGNESPFIASPVFKQKAYETPKKHVVPTATATTTDTPLNVTATPQSRAAASPYRKKAPIKIYQDENRPVSTVPATPQPKTAITPSPRKPIGNGLDTSSSSHRDSSRTAAPHSSPSTPRSKHRRMMTLDTKGSPAVPKIPAEMQSPRTPKTPSFDAATFSPKPLMLVSQTPKMLDVEDVSRKPAKLTKSRPSSLTNKTSSLSLNGLKSSLSRSVSGKKPKPEDASSPTVLDHEAQQEFNEALKKIVDQAKEKAKSRPVVAAGSAPWPYRPTSARSLKVVASPDAQLEKTQTRTRSHTVSHDRGPEQKPPPPPAKETVVCRPSLAPSFVASNKRPDPRAASQNVEVVYTDQIDLASLPADRPFADLDPAPSRSQSPAPSRAPSRASARSLKISFRSPSRSTMRSPSPVVMQPSRMSFDMLQRPPLPTRSFEILNDDSLRGLEDRYQEALNHDHHGYTRTTMDGQAQPRTSEYETRPSMSSFRSAFSLRTLLMTRPNSSMSMNARAPSPSPSQFAAIEGHGSMRKVTTAVRKSIKHMFGKS